GRPSTSATRMFDGLMSRWTTPLVWACCTARQTQANSSSRRRTDSRCPSQNRVIGVPSTSSMTKYGRPASVAPASKTLAMLGWSIIARAWRSASKRGDDLGGVQARLDDLDGDHAADGLDLLRHVNHAHPAFADLLEQLVWAD